MKKNAIILFLKLPSKGKVKTRLEKDLGPDLVLSLCNAFVNDILRVCASADADTVIAYFPDNDAEKEYKTLLSEYVSFRQRGVDLGDRMFNAFCDVYSMGYKRSVLIGSDIPMIRSSVLEDAFRKLDFSDVVIGPSEDGGYYLAANTSKSNSDKYFADMEWSTPDVYEKTGNRIKQAGYSMARLEMLNDIDDLSDLVKFYETNSGDKSLETVNVISRNLDLIFK
jgi:rSAM/selenodomain-associated transferase 1